MHAIIVVLVCSFWVTGDAADCSVGGAGLCSCSELLKKHIIDSFDDCTQERAVAACISGNCKHASSARGHVLSSPTANASKTIQLLNLPYSFHDDIGPFDMSWGFPSPDTIEIEFSLPSDYYIGLGLTANGVGDAIAGWVDEKGQVHVGDFWDNGSRQPVTDESKTCKNDIEAVSGHYTNGVTTVRFRRKLQTGDKNECDEPIMKGPMDINYAWCDAPWCFDYEKGCKAYEDGCLDSPHSSDASNHVTVDFSGKMLLTDMIV